MSFTSFQQELELASKKSVKVIVNDNRSTMLSVKWDPHCIRVSLHRFFLNAPKNVMNDLACYIRREETSITPSVKSFMEDKMRQMDYSELLDDKRLIVQGQTYNLDEMLQILNRKYFDDKLNLKITWFGKRYQCNKSQVTFGLYHEPLRLIKINFLLDNPKFPDYLVSYVIYHEMLHHVCPSYYDEDGKHRIHNKEFKRKEKQFHQYKEAQEWIKKNKDSLFEF